MVKVIFAVIVIISLSACANMQNTHQNNRIPDKVFEKLSADLKELDERLKATNKKSQLTQKLPESSEDNKIGNSKVKGSSGLIRTPLRQGRIIESEPLIGGPFKSGLKDIMTNTIDGVIVEVQSLVRKWENNDYISIQGFSVEVGAQLPTVSVEFQFK